MKRLLRIMTAILPLLATVIVGNPPVAAAALAGPSLQMPFQCGEVWNSSWHTGHREYELDFNSPNDEGKPILAAAAGQVKFAGFGTPGNYGGYGNVVVISHGSGWFTLYGHMQSLPVVKTGQVVSQGTLIGRVGSTGISTGPHLHFGLHYGDNINNTAQIYFNGVPAYRNQAITSHNCGQYPTGSPIVETTAAASGWASKSVTDAAGNKINAVKTSSVLRPDGARLVYFLNSAGGVGVISPGSSPQYVTNATSGVSDIEALQIGNVTYLYTIRGGYLYEANSSDNWVLRPVTVDGQNQPAQKMSAVLRSDGARIVFVVVGGNVALLAGTGTSSWLRYWVGNHVNKDVRDIDAVFTQGTFILYALRDNGTITESPSYLGWPAVTVSHQEKQITADALSVIAYPDGSRVLYTLKDSALYEAGSGTGWNNLRVGTLTGQSTVSAVLAGTQKYVYTR